MKHRLLILLMLLITFTYSSYSQSDKVLTPTPPMGWNSWNFFEYEISDTILRQIADAMVANGMKEAGYEYIIIDDLWVGGRDNKNKLYPIPERFPYGIKPLADYIHSKGLKIGIYSNAAPLTCAGVTGSLNFEEIDAATFAEWGIDYLKYDYCGAPSELETAFLRYKKMGDALKNCGRDIVFAICEWGQLKPWLWAKAAGGHLWRTTYDSRDCWFSNQKDKGLQGGIIELFDLQSNIGKYNGPDSWNDPDMLMVGLYGKGKSSSLNGFYKGCTPTEYHTNFALWCMLAAPLILNSDLRNLDQATLKLITNKYLIAIDQDPLGKSAQTIFQDENIQVLKKELIDNQYAIAIFNRSDTLQNFSFNLIRDFNMGSVNSVFQIWNEKSISSPSLKGTLLAHECKVVIINKK